MKTQVFVKGSDHIITNDRTTDAGRVRFARNHQAPIYELQSWGVTLDTFYSYGDAMRERDRLAPTNNGLVLYKLVGGVKQPVD